MNLHPTPATRVFALTAGAGIVGAVFLNEPIVILWMGSILAALAIVRSIASLEVAAARRQGFEMLLGSDYRSTSVRRTEHFDLEVILRNRSDVALHVRDILALCSPSLEMHAETKEAVIGAHGNLSLKFNSKGLRIGCGTFHGVFLRVLHASGAFEAPLVFFNPVQFVVYPMSTPGMVQPSRGGLSRQPSDADRSGRMSGDSIELRELRMYQPGDALKKIAWKASARRGTLLVRDEELLERQTLWVLLDASVELWGGMMGSSPLDEGVDRVASLLHKHISLGDRVGLGIISSRVLGWVTPDSGLSHFARLRKALLLALQTWDEDRCGVGERGVAGMVAEHIGRIESVSSASVSPLDPEKLALTAATVLKRYEFEIPEVFAAEESGKILRQYAAAFGLACPLRLEAERWQTDGQLLMAMERCSSEKGCRIIIVSTEPTSSFLASSVNQRRRLNHNRIRVSWLNLDSLAGMPGLDSPRQNVVNASIRWQLENAKRRFRVNLKKAGISVERVTQPRSKAERTPES